MENTIKTTSEQSVSFNLLSFKRKKQIFLPIIIALFLSNFLVAQNLTAELATFRESIKEENGANYGKAIELMESIYSKNKSEYLINLRLGWLKYQSKQYAESIKYYNTATKISNNSIESLLAITYPLAELGKWDELIDAYNSILEKDEQNYAATKQLGIIYFNRKNYRKSKSYFNNLLQNYPSDYYANLYLGWNYLNLGDKGRAEEFFSTLLLFYPNDKSAQDGLKLSK
jgi:tetratricopeptide (TPR) repeat protein